jgi:hypothetical protein
MRNTITVTIDANADEKISVNSQNFNLLILGDEKAMKNHMYNDLLTLIYATKRMADKSAELGVVKEKEKLDKKIDEVIDLIKN